MHTTRLHLCSNPFCLYPSVHHAHTSSLYTNMQDSAVLLLALLGFSTVASCLIEDGAVKVCVLLTHELGLTWLLPCLVVQML